ncbi:MAG: BMP family ABC transporter substrate-binding protein [Acidimicrobiaceae bacterium]|nr:BMP family ABC transporter substrate-binding protein [Acidimicrobiia bacterium]MCY4494978.1 BMP family ABC transporter substrate-binding protein [Acidimicrobiaceae bacterium]
MKKSMLYLVALLAAFGLVAAACGDDSSSTPDATTTTTAAPAPTTEAPQEDDTAMGSEEMPETVVLAERDCDEGRDTEGIRVAIVAPSAENDLAFTQSIVDAVDCLTGVTEVAITPGTFIVEDAGVALRQYAEDGFDLVIGHGSQYGGLVQEIAPDFPDTAFAWGTAVNTFGLPNVSAYTVASDQGGYVLGAVAASLGTNVGIVGPIEVGDAKLYVDGFRLGAEAGGAEVNVVYIESFADVQLASETATGFVNNGADILTGTAQMTVGAISVAENEGVLWFGTQSDQTEAAANGVVAASQVYRWEVALQQLINDLSNGVLGGQSYEINLENGGLGIEYGNWDVPDNVIQLVNTTAQSVIAGNVVTRVDES